MTRFLWHEIQSLDVQVSLTGGSYHPGQLCTPGCDFSALPWKGKNIGKRGGEQRYWPLASLATAPMPSSSRYRTTRLLLVMIAAISAISYMSKKLWFDIHIFDFDRPKEGQELD